MKQGADREKERERETTKALTPSGTDETGTGEKERDTNEHCFAKTIALL